MVPMVRRLFVLVLLFTIPAAGAQATVDSRYLRYEVYWGGLHAADFALSLGRDGEIYRHEFEMRSSGIAEWLFKLNIMARSQGRMLAAGVPLPESYRINFVNRWRSGLMDIRYESSQGDVPVATTVTDWTDPPRRDDDEDGSPIVDAEARTGALDPLAAFTEAVRLAGQRMAAREGEFRIKVFDGRRRFDFVGAPLGAGNLTVLGQKREVQRLRLRTVPISGFNGRQNLLWNGRVFEVSFLPGPTPDSEPMPVRIETDGLGPIINLIAECPDRASCALLPRAERDSRLDIYTLDPG